MIEIASFIPALIEMKNLVNWFALVFGILFLTVHIVRYAAVIPDPRIVTLYITCWRFFVVFFVFSFIYPFICGFRHAGQMRTLGGAPFLPLIINMVVLILLCALAIFKG